MQAKDSTNKQRQIGPNLMISSTAAIIENVGFSTVHSSSLHLLNNLIIAYIENLTQKAKMFAENANHGEAGIKEIEMAYYSLEIDELASYLQSVNAYKSDCIPSFPVKNSWPISVHDFTFVDQRMHTLALNERSVFPSYAGMSASELGMAHLINFNSYLATTDKDESIDSLASPILFLRRAIKRKRPADGKNICRKKAGPMRTDHEKDNPIDNGIENTQIDSISKTPPLKAVLSKQGLKLRLINKDENTPEGFFSKTSLRLTRRDFVK